MKKKLFLSFLVVSSFCLVFRSTSFADNVSIFSDDFETETIGGIPTNWTPLFNKTTWYVNSISSGKQYGYNGVERYERFTLVKKDNLWNGLEFKTDVYVDARSDHYNDRSGMLLFFQDYNHYIRLNMFTDKITINENGSEKGYRFYGDDGWSWNVDTWYQLQAHLTVHQTSTTVVFQIWQGGVKKSECSGTINKYESGKFGLYCWGEKAYFDNVEIFGEANNSPQVSNILCEGQTNPTNVIDVTPEFSWQYSDADGDEQKAYQILVATTEGNLANGPYLWDSGKVISSTNTVPYRGENLGNSTQYFWKIKVWDERDLDSAYSLIQNFTTGILAEKEWLYKKEITISNPGDNLTDYAVKVVLNSENFNYNHCEIDGADIRFKDFEQETELNFYKESWDTSGNSIFWVKISTIPSGTTKIWMFYGNSEANEASNGKNTFDFFEDFKGSSLDTGKWQNWNPTIPGDTGLTVEDGRLYIYTIGQDGDHWPCKGIFTKEKFGFSSTQVIEIKNKWDASVGGGSNKGIRITDSIPAGTDAGNQYRFEYENSNKYRFVKDVGGSGSTVVKFNLDNNVPVDYEWERYELSNNSQKMYRSFDNLIYNSLWTATETLFSFPGQYYLGFGCSTVGEGNKVSAELDWIRVRNFSSPEPQITEVGEEKPANDPPELSQLLCEGQTNPLRLTQKSPQLQWSYFDLNEDEQNAYQIIVDTDISLLNENTGNIWNTGIVSSSVSSVVYAGSILKSETTYFWKVKVWDARGAESLWAQPAYFSTGLFLLKTTLGENLNAKSLQAGDLDNDGKLDLILGNYGQANCVYKNSGGEFSLSWSSSETDNTNSVSVADIDNDGKLDLVVGNYGQVNRVYKNLGGGFNLIWSSSETDNTNSVNVADLDNDGKLDLIVGNYDQVNRVYKNLGEGNFSLSWSSSETENTNSVNVADIDKDGDLDLIFANQETISVYINKGDSFVLEKNIASENLVNLIVADFDNDGKIDLISGAQGGNLKFYKNEGGNFTNYWVSSETMNVRGISAGDIDTDGFLDLVVANYNQKNFVYKNTGDACFSLLEMSATDYPATDLKLLDIDNDKDLDYIYCNENGPLIICNSDKSLEKENLPPAPPAAYTLNSSFEVGMMKLKWDAAEDDFANPSGLYYQVKIGTFSGGENVLTGVYGSPFLGNYIRPTISNHELGLRIVPSAGTTYYWQVRTIDPGLSASEWSDEKTIYIPSISGNPPLAPLTPLCEAETNPREVKDWTPEFSWTFNDPDLPNDQQGFYRIIVSSIEGNINSNIGDMWDSGIVYSANQKNISYEGKELQSGTTYWWKVKTGDKDGLDGLYCGAQFFVMAEKLLFTPLWNSSETNKGESLSVSDLNNDGYLDFIVGNYGQKNCIYINNKNNSFTTSQIGEVKDTKDVIFVDIDNDGDLDLIEGNYQQKNILYLNDNGNFSLGTYFPSIDSTLDVESGDVNNDGRKDIIFINYGQSSAVYYNQKDGSFSLAQNLEANYSYTGCLGDIDNDGDLDLVIGNQGESKVYINQEGIFDAPTNISGNYATRDVKIADLDNDGNLEIVIVNYGQGAKIYKYRSGSVEIFKEITFADSAVGVSLGDFDNDGDLDLLFANQLQENKLYENEGADEDWNFSLYESSLEIDNTSDICFADFDNDGDLDYLVANYEQLDRVYLSSLNIPNTSPTAPTSFDSDYNNGKLSLSWNAGSDIKTPSAGLYYNVKVSSISGGNNVVSGKYSSPLLGNYLRPKIGSNLGINLNILAEEVTYYWSVQSIDTGLKASDFSGEQQIYISGPAVPTEFKGIAISTNSIKWSWKDNSQIEQGYRLFSNSEPSPIIELPANTQEWTEAGLEPNNSYICYIQAFKDSNLANSKSYRVWTLACPPEDLIAVEITTTSIQLEWDGKGGTCFALERKEEGGNWARLFDLEDNYQDQDYHDTNLKENTKYLYRVFAYNGDGIITQPSAEIEVKTESIPVAAPSSLSINSLAGGELIKSTDKIIVEGKAEPNLFVYEVKIKDENNNVLENCWELVKSGIDENGNLRIEIKLIQLSEIYPLVQKIKVEIILRDSQWRKSAPISTAYLTISPYKDRIIAYNNLFKPLQGQKCKVMVELTQPQELSVKIYNIAGELVKNLFSGTLSEGKHPFDWDARNDNQETVASGIYLVHIQADNFRQTIKVAVIK